MLCFTIEVIIGRPLSSKEINSIKKRFDLAVNTKPKVFKALSEPGNGFFSVAYKVAREIGCDVMPPEFFRSDYLDFLIKRFRSMEEISLKHAEREKEIPKNAGHGFPAGRTGKTGYFYNGRGDPSVLDDTAFNPRKIRD